MPSGDSSYSPNIGLNKGFKARLANRTAMPHVVVIGAGTAGLTVAKQLSFLDGFKITILEATKHIGGRIKTVEVGNAQVDLGASWMHETRHNPLFAEAIRRKWPMKHTDADVRLFNQDFEVPRGCGTMQNVKEIESIVSEYFHQEKPLLEREPSLKEFVQKIAFKKMPLVGEWERNWTELIYRHVELFIGQKWSEIPAGEGGEQSPLGRDAFMIGRGFAQVIEMLISESNKKRIRLRTGEEVSRIDSDSEDGFVVTTNKAEYSADYVVCTIPLGALKLNTAIFDSLHPHIQPVLDTVQNTGVAALGKVAVYFQEEYWKSDVDTFIVANKRTGEVVSIINPYLHGGAYDQPSTSVLIALTGPDLTQQLEADPDNAYRKLEWAFLAIDGDLECYSQPLEVVVTDWTQSKYFGGSYSARSIGQSYDDQVSSFIEGVGNLRFAGEHTILEGNGCVHGAYLSGIREAKYIEEDYNSKSMMENKKVCKREDM